MFEKKSLFEVDFYSNILYDCRNSSNIRTVVV